MAAPPTPRVRLSRNSAAAAAVAFLAATTLSPSAAMDSPGQFEHALLRQRIEVRLAMLQMERRDYPAALALIGGCRVMCVVQGVGYMWWLGGAAGLAFAAP